MFKKILGTILVVIITTASNSYFSRNFIVVTPSSAQSIINTSLPGDNILLGEGTYSNLIVKNSGVENNPISIECLSGAIITGNNFGISIDGNYIQLSNCEVKSVKQHGILSFGRHIIIKNNVVHDNVWENGTNGNCTLIPVGGWASAISIKKNNSVSPLDFPTSDDVLVVGNTVYHNCGEGIASTRTSNVTIDNNIVYDNYGVNIYVDNSFSQTVSNNNVMCSNFVLRDGHVAYGIGTGEENYNGWTDKLHDVIIAENRVDGCFDGVSIYASHKSTYNILVDKNTISNCKRYAITNRATISNMVVSNNFICSGGNSFVPSVGVSSFGNILEGITATPVVLTKTPTVTPGKTNTATFISTVTLITAIAPTPTSTPAIENICVKVTWNKLLNVRISPSMFNIAYLVNISPNAIVPVEDIVFNSEGGWAKINNRMYFALYLISNNKEYGIKYPCK